MRYKLCYYIFIVGVLSCFSLIGMLVRQLSAYPTSICTVCGANSNRIESIGRNCVGRMLASAAIVRISTGVV